MYYRFETLPCQSRQSWHGPAMQAKPSVVFVFWNSPPSAWQRQASKAVTLRLAVGRTGTCTWARRGLRNPETAQTARNSLEDSISWRQWSWLCLKFLETWLRATHQAASGWGSDFQDPRPAGGLQLTQAGSRTQFCMKVWTSLIPVCQHYFVHYLAFEHPGSRFYELYLSFLGTAEKRQKNEWEGKTPGREKLANNWWWKWLLCLSVAALDESRLQHFLDNQWWLHQQPNCGKSCQHTTRATTEDVSNWNSIQRNGGNMSRPPCKAAHLVLCGHQLKGCSSCPAITNTCQS